MRLLCECPSLLQVTDCFGNALPALTNRILCSCRFCRRCSLFANNFSFQLPLLRDFSSSFALTKFPVPSGQLSWKVWSITYTIGIAYFCFEMPFFFDFVKFPHYQPEISGRYYPNPQGMLVAKLLFFIPWTALISLPTPPYVPPTWNFCGIKFGGQLLQS